MSEKSHRLLTIKDTVSGMDTTVLLSRATFPDNERIVYPRESEHLVFHQIGGTYETLEDFNLEWDHKPEQVEKTVICPKCREPITYLIPKIDEFVNFTCMGILDARRLTNAFIKLLTEPVIPEDLFDVEEALE
ncbi:unnamed protein product [marine sediment metagenome]|uniref:Uncharacterized protein n=1 Tax=marine sediment metagenome TaxID=412755 RepID=X1H9P7_9ZZZZ